MGKNLGALSILAEFCLLKNTPTHKSVGYHGISMQVLSKLGLSNQSSTSTFLKKNLKYKRVFMFIFYKHLVQNKENIKGILREV